MLEPRNSQNIIWRSQRALSGTFENVGCCCLRCVLASQVHGANSLDTIIIDRGVDEPIRIAVVPFAIDVNRCGCDQIRDLAKSC